MLLCGQHHRLLHEGAYALTLRGDVVTVYDNLGRLVPHVPALPDLRTTDHDDDRETPRTSPRAADRRPTDPLPLDPVNGGPLELEYAVGVVAERWQLHSVS